jgi:hypothetical protein
MAELDREALKKHVQKHAFDVGRKCEACDGEGKVYPGDRVVHTRMGAFGADWDEDAVLRAIDSATDVQWARGMLGPYLAILTAEGKVVAVDVPEPVEATASLEARHG